MLKDEVMEIEDAEIYQKPCPCEVVLEGKYARKSDGKEFYPRDRFGNQYRLENIELINNDGQYVYPLTAQGKPRYKVENGSQIYEKINGKSIIGVDADGNEHYAVNEKGDEYYPDEKTPAKLADGTPHYATSSKGNHIFPIDEYENEYYITYIDLTKPSTIPNRYATSFSGDQIYPWRLTADKNEEQYIINNTYAIDKNKNPFYPKDGFNNEYYKQTKSVNDPDDHIVLNRYALTNDGKIILPVISDKIYIDPNMTPLIKRENVIGKLIREEGKVSGYLTNVIDETFQPSFVKPYKYKSLVTKETKLIIPKQPTTVVNFLGIINNKIPFYRRWCFWVMTFVILLVKVFVLWWFYFRKYFSPSFIVK